MGSAASSDIRRSHHHQVVETNKPVHCPLGKVIELQPSHKSNETHANNNLQKPCNKEKKTSSSLELTKLERETLSKAMLDFLLDANDLEMKLVQVIHLLSTTKVSKNQYLWKKGDQGSAFYIVASGTFQIQGKTKLYEHPGTQSAISEDQTQSVIPEPNLFATPGTRLADHALYSSFVHTTSCVAMEDSVCWMIPEENFSFLVGLASTKSQVFRLSCLVHLGCWKEMKDPLENGWRPQFHQATVAAGQHLGTNESFKKDTIYILDEGKAFIKSLLTGYDQEVTEGAYYVPARQTDNLYALTFISYSYIFKEDLPDSPILLQDLKLLRIIGSGSFGQVYSVEHVPTQKLYALKRMDLSSIEEAEQEVQVMNEQKVLKCLDHPFLLHHITTIEDFGELFIVTDYIQGGELWKLIHDSSTTLSLEYCKFFAANVLLAIEYLHQLDIVYRDLKPENILIDSQGYLTLIDMGFAKQLQKENNTLNCERTFTVCGTPEYIKRQLLGAFGILIYEMLTKTTPFCDQSNDPNAIFSRILLSSDAGVTFPSDFPSISKDLVTQLLQCDPEKRLGCLKNGIEDIKKHPFFDGIDWDMMLNKKLQAPYIPTPELSCWSDEYEDIETISLG